MLMKKDKTMHIQELKQRIARDEYVVDPTAVADAIVERTLERHRRALERVREHTPTHRPVRERALDS